MEQYTVSARKYRPRKFSDVVGQQQVTSTLRNAIMKDHLGHSFLFCGPRGVGKTTCARILAKTINCTNRTAESEACNECDSCKAFNNQQSFNIYELDAASNNSVEDMRNLVQQVRYAPQSGKYKTYIIDEVHMLSQAAFNAFLKTLEEPPSYAIFIMATTEKHKILPTILSRCQIFDFQRIRIKDITEQLQQICREEGLEAAEEALHIIAQKADGAMRDALSIFDRITSFTGEQITYQDVIQNLNILDYEYYFKLTDQMLERDVAETLLTLHEIHDRGFDLHNLLLGLSEHFRNLLVCKHPATVKLLELPESAQERYRQQAEKLPLSLILTAMNILNQFEQGFKASKNQRLHVELALIKLCHIPDALQLAGALQNGDPKKKAKPVEKTPEKESEKAENVPSDDSSLEPEPAAQAATSPAAKKEKETKPKMPDSGGGAFGSLHDVKRQVKAKKQQELEEASENNSTAEEPEAIIPLDPEAATKAWKDFVAANKDRNSFYSFLAEQEPEIKENEIWISLPSSHLISILEMERTEMAEHLKKELKNNSLVIRHKKVQSTGMDTSKYLVNDREIFKRMAELNPVLKKLKSEFDLDVGY
ncbi:MAG: DNA polymerase III subunit gamma/tau [Bacteroidia bacterium]